MLAAFAALGLIFLLGLALLAYRHAALARRENEQAVKRLWEEIDRLDRGLTFVGMSADSAVYAAQRAEGNSIAARVLVTDSCPPPTRKA